MWPSISSLLRYPQPMLAKSLASPSHLLVKPAVLVSRHRFTTSMSLELNRNGGNPARTPLPGLSAEEYRKYNRLAFGMEGMHRELRHLWLGLQSECTRVAEPLSATGMQRLIEHGLTFCNELQEHHDREEAFLFPKLAARMPEFEPQSFLVDQHEKIQIGLAALRQYLLACHNEDMNFDRAEMKKIMDTFSKTLEAHLDDEVYALRAEKIRQHWTLDEFRSIP